VLSRAGFLRFHRPERLCLKQKAIEIAALV
jgi:hypothetical protein